MTGSRGGVTEGWVGLLRGLFGSGVWGIPLVIGALGLWLIIRAIERMPNMSWQRPLGFAILFLALITAAALRLAPEARLQAAYAGEGGGELGTAFADGLQALLGSWGAWAAVTFLFILGIVFLADRLLSTVGTGLATGAATARKAACPAVPPRLRRLCRHQSSRPFRCRLVSYHGGSGSCPRRSNSRRRCHRRHWVRPSCHPEGLISCAPKPRVFQTTFWPGLRQPHPAA